MENNVGVVGVGNMGSGISKNLIKAGFNVIVYDLRPEPLEEIKKKGATVASSLKELAQQCPIVFSVPDAEYPQEKLTGYHAPSSSSLSLAPSSSSLALRLSFENTVDIASPFLLPWPPAGQPSSRVQHLQERPQLLLPYHFPRSLNFDTAG